MCEDKNGLPGSVFDSLFQIAFQYVCRCRRIGLGTVVGVADVVVGSTEVADGDEGVSLDENILMERVGLVTVKRLQTVAVVCKPTAVEVVVVARHEQEAVHRMENVLSTAEKLHELFILASGAILGQIAHHNHRVQSAVSGQMAQCLRNLHLISFARKVAYMRVGNDCKDQTPNLLYHWRRLPVGHISLYTFLVVSRATCQQQRCHEPCNMSDDVRHCLIGFTRIRLVSSFALQR